MKYQFKMNVSETDFLEFYNDFLRKSLLKRSNLIIYGVMLITLVIYPILTQEYDFFIYTGLFLVLVGVLFLIMRRQGKKLYDRDPEAYNMNYTLTDKEISFSTDQGSSSKYWSEFYHIIEKEKYIFLYLKNKRGLIFVKESMEQEALDFLIKKSTENMKAKEILLLEK